MKRNGYVYILTNFRKTVLYIGVTSNLQKRVFEHKYGKVDGFTKTYKVTDLIYYEIFDNITNAIRREKSLKGKTRRKKENLISTMNPNWEEIIL